MIGLRHLSGASRREARYGENSSRPGRRCTNNRLHQPGSDYKGFSREGNSIGSARARKEQYPRTRAAGPCGDVLRHRAGVVHASIATRSVEVPAGRSAMAVWTEGFCEGDWQVRYLASENETGMGTCQTTAR